MTLRFKKLGEKRPKRAVHSTRRCKSRAQGTHGSDNYSIPEGDESLLSVPVGSPLYGISENLRRGDAGVAQVPISSFAVKRLSLDFGSVI